MLLREDVNNEEDRWSEHGLGHLLNPSDPTGDDRSWIAQAWLGIVRRSLGLATEPLPIADRVAVGQITVSSPEVLKPLEAFNAGKPYAEQIKPFNFILSCHVAPFGHPVGADPERFHLIAPYETDPRNWARAAVDRSVFRQALPNQHDAGNKHAAVARVKSYGDVLEEYEFHEEAKCADASGAPCGKQTMGLLQRRHVTIESMTPSARSRISSKKSRRVRSQAPAMCIPSIPIRGAASGRRLFCPNYGAWPFRSLRPKATSTEGRFSESALGGARMQRI